MEGCIITANRATQHISDYPFGGPENEYLNREKILLVRKTWLVDHNLWTRCPGGLQPATPQMTTIVNGDKSGAGSRSFRLKQPIICRLPTINSLLPTRKRRVQRLHLLVQRPNLHSLALRLLMPRVSRVPRPLPVSRKRCVLSLE